MKKILCILCALFVFALPFFALPTVESSADIDNINATLSDYDIENYPTANYFDISAFRPYHQANVNAITSVSNGLVNALVVSSQVDDKSQIGYTVTNVKLYQACPYIVVGETYTLNAESQSITKQFVLSSSDGVNVSWYFGRSLTITSEMLDYSVVVYGYHIANGQSSGDCVISKIMVNKGTTAYPYTPYFYSIYNVGFNDGENYGYSDGYNEGFTDGVSSVNSFWETSSVELYGINVGTAPVLISTLNSSYSTYGIATSGYPQSVSEYSFYSVRFNFSEPKSATDIGFFDNSFYVGLSTAIQVTDIGNTDPVVSVSFSNYLSGYLGPTAQYFIFGLSPYIIQSNTTVRLYHDIWKDRFYMQQDDKNTPNAYFLVTCTDIDVLRNITVGKNNEIATIINDANSKGKADGYNEGKNLANDSLYHKGYDDGLHASTGFYGLLSAVIDAPVSALTGLLNFDVLGINMVDFFTSLLTVAVFVTLLRWFI